MMSTTGYTITLLSVWLLFSCENQQAAKHKEAVAERGVEVMGFDLDRSTHIFEKLATGGRQQVVSDDNDPEQVRLIQTHLKEIASQFRQGNFHGPEEIHGEHMAGLHQLVMGYDRILIEYESLPEGAQILYTTQDSTMVHAIHSWFDAQVTDHGHHAQDHR